ncbi:(R,R)-butanediol dehydrogenase [Martiniozyma asiatica (nom. inval.)]|nr:(R,R)-butanediol dehydrogenase [Martiniozyma asiatica]
MKGLLYYGKEQLRYSEDIEEPQIKNGNDVKVKVAYCGICGTDLHEYLDGPIFFPEGNSCSAISGKKLPLCPGHEFSGIVSEVGSDVTRVKPGDRVVVEATSHCSDRYRYPNDISQDLGLCAACNAGKPNCCKFLSFVGLGTDHGAFGQYVVYGEDHMLKIPDYLPLDLAALVEPLSVAWHAVRCADFKPGQSAVVLGGGPIGLCTILALKGHQAGKIVCSEPAAIRRDFAKKLGVEVFNPNDYEDPIYELKNMLPETEGFTASFDCSGIQKTFDTSIDVLGPGGTAVNVAIWPNKPVQYVPMCLTYQEKRATGSMCYVTQDFADVIKAIEAKLITMEEMKLLITGKVDARDAIEGGFMQLINHKETSVKILIAPNGLEM